AFIHCCLAVVTCMAARRFCDLVPRWTAPLVGLAVLPLGTSSKPDELALCFGMSALMPLLRPIVGFRHVAGSGVLFWLFAGTPMAPAAVLGMIALVYLSACLPASPKRSVAGRRWWQRGLLVLGWAAFAAVTFALCLAPVFMVQRPTLTKP